MTISAASGKFWRTKIVTFTPRYILINNLGDTVFYMQAKTMNFVGSLDAGEHIPFYWVDSAGDHQLCIRLKEVPVFLYKPTGARITYTFDSVVQSSNAGSGAVDLTCMTLVTFKSRCAGETGSRAISLVCASSTMAPRRSSS